MKSNPMKGLSVNGPRGPGGEYQSDMLQLNYGKSTIPSKSNAKPSMMDGPYGGKKPVSGK